MFRISSDKKLLESFRLIDREEVVLPSSFHFPLLVKDYLTWTEPSGHRVYLVFNDRITGMPLGIVFRQTSTGGVVAQMCDWCHSVRGGNAVSLLTATASSNRRVGLYLCHNLSCMEKTEEAPGVDDIPVLMLPRERIQKLIKRMGEFARRELF